MLLFNTKKSNKGKKYFSRKNDMPDVVFAEKAESFNHWFACNNIKLIQYLKTRHAFDWDVFNDNYLKMYENILFSGNDVENYMHYFIRSYYTNLIAENMRQNRFFELFPDCDKSDVESKELAEIQNEQVKLERDIMNYVYENFEIREFELFKMYVRLKPAINYSSLAEITGLKVHNIQRTICHIKKEVMKNKDFSRRRKEFA